MLPGSLQLKSFLREPLAPLRGAPEERFFCPVLRKFDKRVGRSYNIYSNIMRRLWGMNRMKMSKLFALFFALVGIAVASATLWLCMQSLEKEPVLLHRPELAVSRVEELMHAVSEDDYTAASRLLYGEPDLGGDREHMEKISAMIWNAYVDSFSYELVGECTPTATGVAQKVNVSYLDIASVTDGLQERFRTLLQQRVAAAEDVEEIYDENNNYRPDFVDGVVTDAAREALREDGDYVETELTVELVCIRGQWWILPDQTLMQVISGGTIPW